MEHEIRSHLENRSYQRAFELILPAYQNKVFRLALSMLASEPLAEETAQEVFLRVWKGLPGYRGEASLSSWIYTITRNACLTAIRSGGSARNMPIDEAKVQQQIETWRPGPPTRAGKLDLLQLISELPERYRQVLILYYLEEKSYKQVADLLDLPMGTVKTYLHRAKKDLAAAVMEAKIEEGSC